MEFCIEHVAKSFEKKRVLKDIDFVFEEGRIYGLLGRNGAGKTTLFNCINSDISVDGGEFYLLNDGWRLPTIRGTTTQRRWPSSGRRMCSMLTVTHF